LANMSHEIRTPMTAILGYAETLLTEGDITKAPPQRIEAIRTIIRNGEHLLHLINGILDLSKIEAGKLKLEQVHYSPFQLAYEVTSLMDVKADAKGLPLTLKVAGKIPKTIRTDPTRLRQILINIVANAIKFTAVGQVCLEISIVEATDANPLIRFDVRDTGIGMTEQQTGKLFRAFSQVDASTTRKFGGTGLGLAISKRLAEMLGGDITVTSEAAKGSTFRVTVATGPLDDVPMIDPQDCIGCDRATPERQLSANTPPEKLDCRVLLAEDGPDNQRLISFILEKVGARVTLAEDGRVACEKATQASHTDEPFDVILMDMQMPVMDGYEATRKLRTDGYTGPIIALTAHAMDGDREKCLQAGCDNYASKPIDREELIAMVSQYSSRPEYGRERVDEVDSEK
ncbi:MAG: ATP-binding protein, partial [Thermoguttaceae bacterium]